MEQNIQQIMNTVEFEPIEREYIKDGYEIQEFFDTEGILLTHRVTESRRDALWVDENHLELWLLKDGNYNVYNYFYYWESAGKVKYNCYRELVSKDVEPSEYFTKEEIDAGVEHILHGSL
jgi:hypothetical protein